MLFKGPAALFAISSISALAIALILVGATFWVKSHRYKKKMHVMKEAGLGYFEKGDLECINPNLDLSEQADLLPYDRKFEFPKEKLKLKERLGSGCFGVVHKAIAFDIVANEKESTVAIKTIHEQADAQMIKTLTKELKIMIHLGRHLNIVNLLGAVTRNIAKRELMVICEYCEFGNILDFLQNHRSTFTNLIQNGEIIKHQSVNYVKASGSLQTPEPQPSGYLQLPKTLSKPIENMESFTKASTISVNTLDLISW